MFNLLSECNAKLSTINICHLQQKWVKLVFWRRMKTLTFCINKFWNIRSLQKRELAAFIGKNVLPNMKYHFHRFHKKIDFLFFSFLFCPWIWYQKEDQPADFLSLTSIIHTCPISMIMKYPNMEETWHHQWKPQCWDIIFQMRKAGVVCLGWVHVWLQFPVRGAHIGRLPGG